ncbi:MAG: hypothetical protein WCF18_15850 [Chthoniobacteraceae bacterium]
MIQSLNKLLCLQRRSGPLPGQTLEHEDADQQHGEERNRQRQPHPVNH